MRNPSLVLSLAVLIGFAAPEASANVLYNFDFETAWSEDYAPGWENTAYRHGTAPVAQMMQQTTTAHSGAAGVKLIAADPNGLFWAGVNPVGIPSAALDKQYNPYLRAWYFEENKPSIAGQIFAVPETPIAFEDDWTDVQFGGRRNDGGVTFSYIAATASGAQWVDTGVARTGGWHELMMQLSAVDGRIHFLLDGNEVGVSSRSDYTNLGTVGLYTMFDIQALGEGGLGSSTIWDDVQVGSTYVPAPASLLLLGFGLAGLGLARRRKN